jgi:hypothetical protein
MPLILGTNSIKDTGYDVANSLRFDDGSSDSLQRTPSSSGNRRTWTFSTWFKRGNIGSSQWILDAYGGSGDEFHIYISSGNAIGIYTIGGGFGSNLSISTNNLVRDVSAWYNLVVRCDTTQSTASDRLRIYLNGVEASYGTYNNFTLNGEGQVNEASTVHYLGRRNAGDSFDGYFAETVLVDGLSLDPTSFGEFDSDSPTIWKPIDVSGLTFGTNGFYLDFENASSLGADVSGNSNNFTVNNLTSVDQSTDTCTNNYAIFNGLLNTNGTLSEGNLQAQSPASGGNGGISTFGASKGKWYAEFKQVAESTANEGALAVIDTTFLHNSTLTSAYLEYTAGTYGLRDGLSSGVGFYTDSGGSVASNSSFHGNWTTNDTIGIALDIDNNRVYFSKNGQWTDGSGNWDESNPTGYLTIQSTHGEGTYMFAVGDSSSGNNVTWAANFGSPPYSISSGNSDANGYGNFEYAVPSGYYALNTKNLAEFG